MIRHVGSFCEFGGLFFTTTTSASSVLSEICRRVLRPTIASHGRTFADQTRIGAEVFRSHLRNLSTSTRPAEDWVQDSILHDWQHGEYVFTMIDAITALQGEFEFYSSSPRFLFDDRWYKQVNQGSLSVSGLLRQQYPLISAYFLDFRIPLRTVLQIRDTDRMATIESLSKSACDIHDAIMNGNSYDRLDDFLAILAELTKVLPEEFAITRDALIDFSGSIVRYADGDLKTDFRSFEKWWGRGQQYLGLVKTAGGTAE